MSASGGAQNVGDGNPTAVDGALPRSVVSTVS